MASNRSRAGRKRVLPVQVESWLRTSVDILFGRSMLLRGASMRGAELPDLFTVEMKDEGPTPCWPMLLIMNSGKTNQFNKLEYGVVARHRNLSHCTMSAMAFYLFFRWQSMKEAPPSFRRRQDWYRIHVLKGANPQAEICYDTQYDWTTKLFDQAGLHCLKKTHAGRGQGAKHAEFGGVSDTQIRRAGRWNTDAMTICYLSSIPREFVRRAAGFNPTGRGDYFIPRAMVDPPESLRQSLWPWIDAWVAWYREEGPEPEPVEGPEPGTEGADNRDLSGQGFLRLMDKLRTILIQDSVEMRRLFPDHPLWSDPFFGQPEYETFARRMEEALAGQDEGPQYGLLERALPDLAAQMAASDKASIQRDQFLSQRVGEIGTEMATTNREMAATIREMGTTMARMEKTLGDILSGRVPTQGPDSTSLSSALPASAPHDLPSALPGPLPSAPSNLPSALPGPLPSSSPDLPSAGPLTSALRPPARSGPGPLSLPPLPPAGEPPVYVMSRTVQTVGQLWLEWTVGLPGQPAVQQLESTY